MIEDSLEKDRVDAVPIDGDREGVTSNDDEGDAERTGESVGEGVESGLVGIESAILKRGEPERLRDRT